jgi:hypothetical protein
LRAELIERGYDATGFVTLEDAVRRLVRAPARRPALLVLDRHDQTVDERTAALLARRRVPVLVVADIAHAGGQAIGDVVATLRRPVTIGEVADAVARVIAANDPQPSLRRMHPAR